MRMIDADALKEYISHEGIFGIGYSDEERERDVLSMIDEQPTIEPPVKRGEWRPAILSDRPAMVCSVCYEEPYRKSDRHMPNYCPSCGADMRKEEQA